jgi:hypothetical protein
VVGVDLRGPPPATSLRVRMTAGTGNGNGRSKGKSVISFGRNDSFLVGCERTITATADG